MHGFWLGHNIGWMMNRKFWLTLTLLAVLTLACGSEETEPEPVVFSGELHWITPEELTETLAEGPATVLNFWASWCGPCRSEAPVLRQAHERYGDGVRFIGVAVDDTDADARGFIAEYQISFDNYLGDGGAMMAQYQAFGIPFTVFTDPAGEVLNIHRGIIDEEVLGLWTDELSRFG